MLNTQNKIHKASGGDGIPAEVFQILKDYSVKVLYSKCQQIWKTQQWSLGYVSMGSVGLEGGQTTDSLSLLEVDQPPSQGAGHRGVAPPSSSRPPSDLFF